jgi:hypothetical protein
MTVSKVRVKAFLPKKCDYFTKNGGWDSYSKFS